jgi:hypothetical protein
LTAKISAVRRPPFELSPPVLPATEARLGSFLKFPPDSWLPLRPAFAARCGSFLKLPPEF